jgi:hypothetical protein
MFAVRRYAMLLGIAGAVCAAGFAHAAAEPAPAPLVTIRAIRAMPYYAQTGEVRRTTDLMDERLQLWNIIMGSPLQPDINRPKIEPWDAPRGTTATYVAVELTLARVWRAQEDKAVVELQVSNAESGRHMQSQKVALENLFGTGGEEKSWHVPFLIYGTGCEELKITVRVTHGKQVYDQASRTIRFHCGE